MATKTKKPTAKKAKKAKAPQLTPAELRDFAKQTGALADEIKERRGKVESNRQALKSSKEMLAASVNELERITWEHNHPEAFPLFKDQANGKHEPEKPAVVVGPPADDAWKAIPIGEALPDLPKKVYIAFEKNNITTMGEFSEYQAKKGEWWAKDLNGVGPETATKIADAAEKFWASQAKQTVAKEADKIGNPDEAKAS